MLSLQVQQFEKREQLVSTLRECNFEANEKVLIFVDMKKNADFLAAFLSQSDVS